MNDPTTIYALATARGRSGIAVIRVSGTGALSSLRALTDLEDPAPRHAYFTPLVDNVSRETIDEALVLYFKGPASYTGEDVVEYHVHGSLSVIDGLLEALSRVRGHNMAEPGEFTRRAFLNRKLDLTQAEAVADLIHAETSLQRTMALHQMKGGLADVYLQWREDLIGMLAHFEAHIEFPEEDDTETVLNPMRGRLDTLISDIKNHLADNNKGERLRDGLQVAIFGAPNAGKSSLINALAKRDVAIVSDIQGTTRDLLSVHLDLEGIPVTLTDTAGLRHLENFEQDQIEQEGISRALALAEKADIKILLHDGQQEFPDPYTLSLLDERAIVVINKCDEPLRLKYDAPALKISALTGQGLQDLIATMAERAAKQFDFSEMPIITRKRHRTALKDCLESLLRVDSAFQSDLQELIAEDLRLAVRHLGRVTGAVDVEDLLDVIFSDFCIGK